MPVRPGAAERRQKAHEAVMALVRCSLKADEVSSLVELLWREETVRQVRGGMGGRMHGLDRLVTKPD